MVSVDQHTFAMLPRHMSEEQEQYGSLYPDPPQGPFSAVGIDLGLTSDAYYPRFTQDLPTAMSGFEQIPFALDGPVGWSSYGGQMSPPLFQEDREMGVPSNMSTASAPSAPSSAVGSPRSTHGQPAPMPEWAHQGVALGSPGIVSHDYLAGTEYSFAPPQGLEDIAPFAYADASKPPGFVGELPQTPRSVASQHPQQLQQQSPGPFSPSVSRRESSCIFSSESGPAIDTPPEALYAQAAMLPASPQSRNSSVLQPDTPSTSLSSPTPPAWTSPVSPFFSQSSGHFIAPLGSSCWFPC